MKNRVSQFAGWLILSGGIPLFAQYTPIGQFVYTLPNGQDFTIAGDDGVAGALAGQAIEGFERQNAIAAMIVGREVTLNYFDPIANGLSSVRVDQMMSNSAAAATDAANALHVWNNLVQSNKLGALATFLTYSGSNQAAARFGAAFSNYAVGLKQSIDSAQQVSAQIDRFIQDNVAGTRLFAAASHYDATPYSQMTCDQLITKAARSAGIDLHTSITSGTVTKSWFDHGMGSEFRQIVGGANGITLEQLAADEGANRVNLPIGAVIVTDGGDDPHGHAALFAGVVDLNGKPQLILYDANNSDGWQITLEGQRSQTDPPDTSLSFPGHQVGFHVTRLQWGQSRPVKVFQPIGNHPPAQLRAQPPAPDPANPMPVYDYFPDLPPLLPRPHPADLTQGMQQPAGSSIDLNKPIPCGTKNPFLKLAFDPSACVATPRQ